MTVKSGIIWNYYDRSFQDELLSRPHWKTVETYFSGPIPKVDIPTMFRDGCIYGVRYDKGRLKFGINLDGLLAAGHHELLVESVKDFYPGRPGSDILLIQDVIRPYILYGDKKKSLQNAQYMLDTIVDAQKLKEMKQNSQYIIGSQLDTQEIPNSLIFFLAVTLGKKKLALDFLKKKEKYFNSIRLYDLAKCRQLLFQNNRKALTHLKNSVSHAQSVYERIKIATAWKHLFDNEKEARLVLADAKSLIEHEQDIVYYIEAWKMLFNDDKEAIRLISEHENNAKTTSEFYTCAVLWMNLFGDKPSTKRCLHNMEILTKSDTSNIKDIYNKATNNAWLWISLLGNKNKAREWSIEVEKIIKEMEPYDRVSGWERLSQFYESELNDFAEHRRCYAIYEEEYDDFWD